MAGRAASVLLLLLLALPGALAQAAPLQVIGPEQALQVHGGETEEALLTVASSSDDRTFHVRPSVDAGDRGNWIITIQPASTVIAPGEDRTFILRVVADRVPLPRTVDINVTFVAIGQDFTQHVLYKEVQVRSVGTDAILGRWDNPLPAPLDGAWGAFLLNLVAWVVISQLTIWVILPILRAIAKRTPVEEDQRIVQIITRPSFILIFMFGLKQSLEVFALPIWLFEAMDRTWKVILAVAIVYVVYRLWREIILAIGKRVAKRTESELDDMLYPVFEKLGSVLIFVIGLWIIVSSFGVNMALFAAGGAVISLVIAFAAQDTLGNFFAGIFILLDRPFRVGDRIELPEQEHWGDVQEIGLRTTKVRTQDNRLVIFPNAYIGSNPVVNHSYPDPLYRIQVEFRLPYGSDVESVRKTLVDAVKPVEGVHPDKPVEALLLEFTEQGQKWRLRWWINSYADTRRAFDRVNSAVIKKMADAGIRIQYQPITIWDAHKLLERASGGGLAPTQLSESERARLEKAAEATRKEAERQEAEEIEAMKEKARQKEKQQGGGEAADPAGEPDEGAADPDRSTSP